METKIRVERLFYPTYPAKNWNGTKYRQSQDHPTYPNSNSETIARTKSLFYMEGRKKVPNKNIFSNKCIGKVLKHSKWTWREKKGVGEVGFSISNEPSSSARNSCPCRVTRRGVHYVNKNPADAIPGINSVITCRGMAGVRLYASLLPGADDCK